MPQHVFTAGEVLTAANVNTYLMNQAVITCTSGTRPASPTAGFTIYETDTGNVSVYTGTAWVSVGVALASGAWTTYTPVWGATTTNPTIGNGTISGAYRQIGKTVMGRIAITIGSTTTLGTGNYTVGVPAGLAVNLGGAALHYCLAGRASGFAMMGYADGTAGTQPNVFVQKYDGTSWSPTSGGLTAGTVHTFSFMYEST